MYKHLSDGEYTEFQKALRERKGSRLQKDFIDAARSNDKFIEFVRSRVKTEGDTDAPVLPHPLTEQEFKEAPQSTEDQMYIAWKDIPVNLICNTSFWAEVTLNHIDRGIISASFLAANGGASKTGIHRIDTVLKDLKNSEIDACFRTMIRRMSGFHVDRGNKSVFSDCPLGRALWRGRLLKEMAEATGRDGNEFRKVLVLSSSYWEKLVESVVSRNSILGSVTVRYALIWALSDLYENLLNESEHKKRETQEKDAIKHKAFTQVGLGKIVRLLGIRSAWQELGVFELHEIKSIIEQDMFPKLNQ